jgi:TRAP transporter TAXI family solute receptor
MKTVNKVWAASFVLALTMFFLPDKPAAQQVSLSLGSFHTGTATYIYAGMFAGYVRRFLPEIVITNEATGGSSENLDLMRRGEVALGAASPDRIYAAHHGLDRYKDKKTPVTIMWSWSRQPVHMFVRADSSIKSFRDLKGKKIVLGPAGSGGEIKNSHVVEAYGYTRKEKGKFDFVEVQTVKLSWPESANALAEGVVDAVVITQSVPEPSFSELSLRIPLRVIPVEEDMLDKIRKTYPLFWPMKIPAGTYRGQDKELRTVGDDTYITAHQSNLSEEVGYKLTKVYLEQILPEMAKQMDFLKLYVQEPLALVEYTVVPVHPGALKYYKEKGITPKLVTP